MIESIFSQARLAYDNKDWSKAMTLYKKAGELYGEDLVRANIALCEAHLNGASLTDASKNLANQNADEITDLLRNLKLELRRKDIELQQRFAELSKLTTLLESKS